MRRFRGYALTLAVLAATQLLPTAARAETVLLDESGFMTGSQSFVEAFDVTVPSTLTITLTNIAWPEALADLSFVLTSTQGALSGLEQAGVTMSFDLSPGRFYTHVFGKAQGSLNIGVYGLKIGITPQASAVGLPASALLLLSGLALLAIRRGRSDVEPPATAAT